MGKIVIDGLEFPDKCPDVCPDKHFFGSQNSLCIRCPIFNCQDTPFGPMIEPEHYNKEWAKEWHQWFKENGCLD